MLDLDVPPSVSINYCVIENVVKNALYMYEWIIICTREKYLAYYSTTVWLIQLNQNRNLITTLICWQVSYKNRQFLPCSALLCSALLCSVVVEGAL